MLGPSGNGKASFESHVERARGTFARERNSSNEQQSLARIADGPTRCLLLMVADRGGWPGLDSTRLDSTGTVGLFFSLLGSDGAKG